MVRRRLRETVLVTFGEERLGVVVGGLGRIVVESIGGVMMMTGIIGG